MIHLAALKFINILYFKRKELEDVGNDVGRNWAWKNKY